jgi:Calcineurin-like phosphoesterase
MFPTWTAIRAAACRLALGDYLIPKRIFAILAPAARYMPDPEKLLTTIRRAADLTRSTPGRTGHTLRLGPDDQVMVVGDLHGNVGNIQMLLKIADLAHNPNRHLVVQELIHGAFHYHDGSDKSHQAVDVWCALKCQFPARVHYLPGNHELAQWTNRAIAKAETDLNASFLDGVRAAYGRRADDIYHAYLDLFAVLPLVVRTPNRVLISHSLPTPAALPNFKTLKLERDGYDPGDLLPGGYVFSLLWGRDTSQKNVEAFLIEVDAAWLISGHVPCDQGFAVPNDRQIILDCLGSPAAYCLFPAGPPMTQAKLIDCVKLLQ